MSTKKTKKARKLRQQNLPGMEPPKIKAIDNATEAYVEIRDSRMALTKTEVAKRDTVLRLMKEHDLTSYERRQSRIHRQRRAQGEGEDQER